MLGLSSDLSDNIFTLVFLPDGYATAMGSGCWTARRRCRFWSSCPSSARIPASGPFRVYARTLYPLCLLASFICWTTAEPCRVCCGVQGMVDPGEFVTATLRREFAEEALDLEGADEKTKHAIQKRIDEAFANGREVRCIVIRETVSQLLNQCHSCYLSLLLELLLSFFFGAMRYYLVLISLRWRRIGLF